MEDNKFVAVGKVIADLGEQSGTTAAQKAWRKRTFVIETQESFPQKMAFTLFNDRIDQFQIYVGQDVRVSFDISSRDYQGRWYTDLRAWRVEDVNATAAAAAPAGAPAGYPAPGAPTYGAPASPLSPMGQPVAPAGNAPEDLPF